MNAIPDKNISQRFSDSMDFIDHEILDINLLLSKIEECAGEIFKDTNLLFDHLKNTEEAIKKTTKHLKASMQGEANAEKIRTIQDKLSKVEGLYSQALRTIKSSINVENASKNEIIIKKLNQKLYEASKILQNIHEIKENAIKKENILLNKLKFKEKKIPLERFDRLIDKRVEQSPQFKELYTCLKGIVEKVHLKNDEITSIDMHNLSKWKDHLLHEPQETEEAKELFNFVNIINEQIKETQNNKIALLKKLNEEFKKNSSSLTNSDYHKYSIFYHQIIGNPFEIPLAKNLIIQNPQLSKYLTFTNRLLSSDKEPISDEDTLHFKIEGLQRLRKASLDRPGNKQSGDNILISGAGAGGLMLGLNACLQAKNFHIIESRGQNDPMRKNIVALGKSDDSHAQKMLRSIPRHGSNSKADLKLLDFFGITDRLKSEGKFDSSNRVFSAQIKDLQNAMLEQIRAIGQFSDQREIIHYNTEIGEIIPPDKEGDPCKVKLKTSARTASSPEAGLNVEMLPTIVHVMEGYRTTTRDLLGIEVIKESKAARMAFSFFSAQKSIQQAIIQKLQFLVQALLNIPSLIRIAIELKDVDEADLLDKFVDTVGRFELLLRNPESDYFYYTFSKKEKEEIVQIEEKLNQAQWFCNELADEMQRQLEDLSVDPERKDNLNDLKKKFAAHPRTWLTSKKEREEVLASYKAITKAASHPNSKVDRAFKHLEELNSDIAELQNILNKLLQEIAIDGRVREDIINSFELKKWKVDSDRNYIKTDMTYNQVQRAETNYRHVGNTHFYIGGDAESTTDPASGSGFRTALLRTVIASEFLDHPALRDDPMMRSAFEWSSQRISKSMREEGLNMRHYYVKGDERIERYIGLGEDAGFLDENDRKNLLKLHSKVKIIASSNQALSFSKEEMEVLKNLKDKLKKENAKELVTLDATLKEVGCTEDESAVFTKAKNHVDKPNFPMLASNEFETFKSASAKIALGKPFQQKLSAIVYLSIILDGV